MITRDEAGSPAEDESFAALLRAVGSRPQPSERQLERWRAHFEAELAAAQRRRGRRRGLLAGAVAIALVTVAVLVPWRGGTPVTEPAPLAEVRTARGGVVVRHDAGRVEALEAGARIRAGQRVESGRSSHLGVRVAGADVRFAEDTVVVFREGALELLRGRLYVDTRPATPSAAALQVVTPLGRFSHVGTQYLVRVSGDEVAGVVREGTITWRLDGDEAVLRAPATGARMAVISSVGGLRESEVPSHGPLWKWTEAASGGLVLAGRRAEEVLDWIARERGLRLSYDSRAARSAAREARLAGSDERLLAEAALEVIGAATRLRPRTEADGTLVVALASEGDQQPQ